MKIKMSLNVIGVSAEKRKKNVVNKVLSIMSYKNVKKLKFIPSNIT